MQLTHKRRTCARIRRGLYNYRGYNIRRYPHGWAVRGEENEPFGSFAKRLRDIRGIIDLWYSPNMVAQASFFRELTGPGLPRRLPTADEVPVMMCVREVVRHPSGGWTIAEPIDATQSAARTYRGNWSSKAAALAAMEGHQ